MKEFAQKDQSPQQFSQGRHKDYRFLVTYNGGWTHEWVHCPVCRSVNDGWTPDGVPAYTGGFVALRASQADSSVIESVAACRCAAGEVFAQGSHVEFYDESPPSHREHVAKTTFYVLWDKHFNESRPAWIPSPTPPEQVERYNMTMAEQFSRHLSGKTTAEEFSALQVNLEANMMPAKLSADDYEAMRNPDNTSKPQAKKMPPPPPQRAGI